MTLVVINIIMALYLYPWRNMLYYITNWCLMVTFLSILSISFCAFYASFSKDIMDRNGMLAATHILFEFAFALNLIVVVVHWSVVHD